MSICMHLNGVILPSRFSPLSLVSISPVCQLEHSQHDPLVLLPEVLVRGPINHRIQAAVKVCHEIAGGEEPFWD